LGAPEPLGAVEGDGEAPAGAEPAGAELAGAAGDVDALGWVDWAGFGLAEGLDPLPLLGTLGGADLAGAAVALPVLLADDALGAAELSLGEVVPVPFRGIS
jgi:hypothetical protein